MKNRNRIKKIIIFIIIAILFGLGQSGARKQENAKTINSNKNTVGRKRFICFVSQCEKNSH